ncbi:MAG: twitching motility protein PilT [Chloroflexi bacterium 44-23]|nr:MAG: twitching motility protein PilT [Chloroflexi bacterium 44-23]
MRALLDTHTFLWWNMNDPQLSTMVKEIISDGSNEIYLSAASVWEIAIKVGKGRLLLPEEPGPYIASRMKSNHFSALPIQISHTVKVYNLPHYHEDPFDRLLIAQSQMEKLILLTINPEIRKYQIETIW